MKNRKILLPALLAIVLAFSLMPLASVVVISATLHLSDDYAITHSAVSHPSPASALALNMASVMGQRQATPMGAAGY